MRVLTYNLWHGLDGQGLLFFGELEPRGRQLKRAQTQIRCLKQWSPDVLFLQEANPLVPAVYFYASQLQLDHIEQMDLSGIKLLGLGPPFNLQSGLIVLGRSEFNLNRLLGLQLSGEGPANRGLFSLQLKESRYALFGEIRHPEWGKVLVVNVHLHHGLEYDPAWTLHLNRAVQEGQLSEPDKRALQKDLHRGDVRREGELALLLEHLNSLSSSYDLTLLGGDFNSSPDSPIVRRILEEGFEDGWQASGVAEPGLTWDCLTNPENHEFNDGFQKGFDWQEELGPAPMREELLEKVREAERRPRRIDYLFFRTSHRVRVRSELFEGKDPRSGMLGSDHFGVGVILEKDS